MLSSVNQVACSQRATDFLKEQGYQATNIQGGMNAWNGPIKGGKNESPIL